MLKRTTVVTMFDRRTEHQQPCRRLHENWIDDLSAEERSVVISARLDHMQAAWDATVNFLDDITTKSTVTGTVTFEMRSERPSPMMHPHTSDDREC